MENNPLPIQVTICSVCSQPWDRHRRDAEQRINNVRRMEDPYENPVWYRASDKDVTLLECIDALKEANRGPLGPQGPMGPQGISS